MQKCESVRRMGGTDPSSFAWRSPPQLDEAVDERPCSQWDAGEEEVCQLVERLGSAVCAVELVEVGQSARLDDLSPVDRETLLGDEGVLLEGEAEPLLRGENQGSRVDEWRAGFERRDGRLPERGSPGRSHRKDISAEELCMAAFEEGVTIGHVMPA